MDNSNQPPCRPTIRNRGRGLTGGWEYGYTCSCRPDGEWLAVGAHADVVELATAHLMSSRVRTPEPAIDPEHAASCFTCWLRALGVDMPVAAALLMASRAMGWGDALSVMRALGADVPFQLQFVPPAGLETMATVEQITRRLLAVPPSADVATAMGGH